MRDDMLLRQLLEKEVPVLTRMIRTLYKELDQKYKLRGSEIPITFGMDETLLGSYTRKSAGEEEHFHFSLLFVGFGVAHPLSKEDRLDIFRHEYAHYMQYNMTIPEKYKWQPGIHGSAWKYCCSLVGAVPTPYYKAGEVYMKHDYDKVLKNPIHDKTVPLRDTYQREQQYKKEKALVIHYNIGDEVAHPKFGKGTIHNIEKRSTGVHLHIRFGEEIKCIDQKWLMRVNHTNKSSRQIT